MTLTEIYTNLLSAKHALELHEDQERELWQAIDEELDQLRLLPGKPTGLLEAIRERIILLAPRRLRLEREVENWRLLADLEEAEEGAKGRQRPELA